MDVSKVVDDTLTIDMGAVNCIVSPRLFRKISADLPSQLAKTAPIDAAVGERLK